MLIPRCYEKPFPAETPEFSLLTKKELSLKRSLPITCFVLSSKYGRQLPAPFQTKSLFFSGMISWCSSAYHPYGLNTPGTDGAITNYWILRPAFSEETGGQLWWSRSAVCTTSPADLSCERFEIPSCSHQRKRK
jgi:hypothetical protein